MTTTVFNTVVSETGKPIAGLKVTAYLVRHQFLDGVQKEVIALRITTETNENGEWSLNLIPNDVMDDTESYYIVEEGEYGTPIYHRYYIRVPTASVPVWLKNIIIPQVPPPPVLQEVLNNVVTSLRAEGQQPIKGDIVLKEGIGISLEQDNASKSITISASGALQHSLLDGEIHPDTQPTLVQRGMLIVGRLVGGVVKWAGLLLGGAGKVLKSNGQDVEWDNVNWNEIANKPTSFPVTVQQSGTTVGTRSTINFIAGSNVTINAQDDAGGGRVNVTISSLGVAQHNLLDNSAHPDTETTTVQRGMLIVGRLINNVLRWAGLPLGASGKFLKSDGNDVVWGNIEASDLPAHAHSADDITSGRLSVQRLPTSPDANRFLVVRTPNSDPTYDSIQASDLPAHTHSPTQISPQGHGSGLNADTVDGVHASSFEQVSNKGQPNGYAPLDNTGKLPTTHLPSHTHSPSDVAPQGHTSNLNADMVDGYHASDFALATHTHSASDITSGRLTLQRMPTSSTANRFLVVRTANSDPTYDSIKASDLPSHTHTKADITDFTHTHAPNEITPQGSGSGLDADTVDGLHATSFENVANKGQPNGYAPLDSASKLPLTHLPSHQHTKSDITDFAHTHTKADITDFAHTHTKSEITDFAHTHAPNDITPQGHNSGLNADMLDGYHASAFEQLTNKGQAGGYAPLDSNAKLPLTHLPSHSHNPSDIAPQGHGSGLNADMVDGIHASSFEQTSNKGQPNGYAPLDSAGKLPTTHLPTHSHSPSDITPQGHGSGLNADMLDGVHASSLVPTSRQINAGTGLTGGGDLSQDRTLSVVENLRISTIGLVIGDGINEITTGFKGAIWIPFSGTITEWTILSTDGNPPTSGSIEIDVLKSTFTNYPTMTSMVGTGTKPNITNSNKGNGTPNGWTTTTINAGDCIGFNVTSVTSLKRVTLVLKVVKS